MGSPQLPSPEILSRELKAEASRIGLDACGIAVAERLEEEERRLRSWLDAGRHGTMSWMANHFEKRVDPRILVPGARSVVSVLHNYYQPDPVPAEDPALGRITRYAWGDDYHQVMREKLQRLLTWLGARAGGVKGRAFVDSAPVMDKAWAQRAGLGWIGKHTNLISREIGSYFFIGELIVDTELAPDEPIEDYCGSCTRCIDACPTDALGSYQLDSNRCISYLTIEFRGNAEEIPEELRTGTGNWIFGCDVCQDVCPWNKYSRPTEERRYEARPGVTDTMLREWSELDEESFRDTFEDSPVLRARLEGFRRNVGVSLANVASTGRNQPGAPAVSPSGES